MSQMNESCLTDKWVMPDRWDQYVTCHRWMSHVSQMHESCLTDERVMCHGLMSYVSQTNIPQRNESCHRDKWVMSHRCMSHVSQDITNVSSGLCRSGLQSPRIMSRRVLLESTLHMWIPAICKTGVDVDSSKTRLDISYSCVTLQHTAT